MGVRKRATRRSAVLKRPRMNTVYIYITITFTNYNFTFYVVTLQIISHSHAELDMMKVLKVNSTHESSFHFLQ